MRKKRGFTLIESLVALVLLVLVIGFIFTIFTSTRQGMKLSENHANAAMIGKSKLNELSAMVYETGMMYAVGAVNKTGIEMLDLYDNRTGSVFFEGYSNDRISMMRFEYQIDIDTINSSIYQDQRSAGVTVRWADKAPSKQGQDKSLIVETIMTDIYY